MSGISKSNPCDWRYCTSLLTLWHSHDPHVQNIVLGGGDGSPHWFFRPTDDQSVEFVHSNRLHSLVLRCSNKDSDDTRCVLYPL